MLKYPFLFAFLIASCSLSAQHLHTPTEITRLIEQSSINYVIDSLSKNTIEFSFPIIEVGNKSTQFPKSAEQSVSTIVVTDKTSKKYQKKAAIYFSKENYLKAIPLYLKMQELNPDNIPLQYLIAHTYSLLNDCPNAMQSYEQLIAQDRLDIQAHLKMAELCVQCGEGDKAVQYITRAHLFNRNDPVIIEAMIDIYRKRGLIYQDWKLQPQYSLNQDANKRVVISATKSPWRAYAACKALWQYEPAYREKMGAIVKASSEIVEEKECLLNALISYTQMGGDKTAFPELEMLAKVLTKRVVNDYIFYEIAARRNPQLLRDLPEEELNKMVHYVTTQRISNGEEQYP